MRLSKTILRETLIHFYMYAINHLYGTNKRKFIFTGMGGGYNDNSRAVSEKLHELYPQSEIYWFLLGSHITEKHIPNYVHKINGYWNFLYHMSTAVCWCTCGYHNSFYYKSPKQIAVTFWHGDRAFKKILCDAGHTEHKETKMADLMTSGSVYYDKIITTAFGYTGDVLHSGCPRNDALFDVDIKKTMKIKEELSLPADVKILLYAPTFRDHSVNEQIENIDIERTLYALENKSHNNWICLGRFHPKTQGKNKFKNNKVIDVSSYFDMTNLLYISDALITDYSSSAGDFIILKRPVYIYQADRNEYLRNDRAFYFNMEDSPYWIANSQDELEEIIMTTSKEGVVENCKKLADFYGMKETGHACEDVINYILNKMLK